MQRDTLCRVDWREPIQARPVARSAPSVPKSFQSTTPLVIGGRDARPDRTIFPNENYLDQALVLAYGHRATALLKLIGRLMIDIGPHAAIQKTGKYEDAVNWIQVPFALDQTAKGVSLVFEALQDPDADRSPPTEKTPKIGEAMARGALVAIKDRDAGGELGDWARPIRENLGEIVARIRVDPRMPVMINATPPQIAQGGTTVYGRIIDTQLGRSLLKEGEKP